MVVEEGAAKHSSNPRAGGHVQPGIEKDMTPTPEVIRKNYKGADKMKDKVAIITGGDSGIGRSVAVHFAREGAAAITIAYKNEDDDAEETKRMVEEEGARVLLIPGDIGDPQHCRKIVEQTVESFGKLDVLVNNAAEQHWAECVTDITPEQLERTFRTNIFGQFFMSSAAVEKMNEGAAIVNSTSVTAYKGMPKLVDYASSKGAIVAFTRSLALQLAPRKIRVNGVAPGPIWTPLIPATFHEEKVKSHGTTVPLERDGQPSECAPAYVFLASEDGSYFTGQVLHPNGGSVVNG